MKKERQSVAKSISRRATLERRAILHRLSHSGCLAVLACGVSATIQAQAGPSETSPYVGWGYGQLETPRAAGMAGALRASSSSTEAIYFNPANMATTRVYHVGALAMIWPRSSRQTYGGAAMDSIVSSSQIAGGIAGSYTFQDPEGVDREIWDIRAALAFPFTKSFYAGISGRYMNATQSGYPRNGNVLPPFAATGLGGEPLGMWVTFDAGMTIRPIEFLSLSVVGSNLTNPGNYFLPLMLSGAAAWVSNDFTFEFDWVGDFTTYLDTTHRFMAGAEYLILDRVPVRVGYQYDQGAETQSISGGVGYLAREFSIDIAFRQSFVGEPVTSLFFGAKYHLESSGLSGAN